MKHGIVLTLSFALLLSLVSCTSPADDGNQMPPALEDRVQPAPEEVPSVPPAPPARITTQAWQDFARGYPQPDEVFVHIVSVPANSPEAERYPQLFAGEPVAALGDPDADDAVLFGFGLRYPDANVTIYALAGYAHGHVTPDNLSRLFILNTQVEGDRFTILASGFSIAERDPPRYRFTHAIVIETTEGEAVFYPTDIRTRQWIGERNISTRALLGDLSLPGNTQPIPDESVGDTDTPQNRGHRFTDRDFNFLSGFGRMHFYSELLGTDWRSSPQTPLNEFIAQHHQSQGYSGDFSISHTFTDMRGNTYYVVGNALGEHLYMVRRDADTGEFETTRTISEQYDRDNRYIQLPLSARHLNISTPAEHWHSGGGRLVQFNGRPGETEYTEVDGVLFRREIESASEYARVERIRWMMNPIVNPNNTNEHLLFGVLHDQGEDPWRLAEPFRFIVMLRRGNSIVNWFITDEMSTNSAYINVGRTISIIAGVNEDEFTQVKPYTARFSGSTVRVYFPGSFATYTFDFDNFSVSAVLEYDESFRGEGHNTFMYATPDGRFELWQMNENWWHEGRSLTYGVFDTHTGRVIDFHNYTPSYWVNLVGNTQAAVLSPNGILLYDLPTMTYSRIQINFDQVYAYNDWTRERRCASVEAYIWDHYRNRHVLLTSRGGWSNFTLRQFSADGSYISSLDTQVQTLTGKFTWHPPEVHIVADGQLYIRDPFRRDWMTANALVDLDTGEHTQWLYPRVERAKIERMLRNQPIGGGSRRHSDSPTNATHLSEYIRSLRPVSEWGGDGPSGAENGAEIYTMILDAIDRLASEDFARVPGADLILNMGTNTVYAPYHGENGFSVNTIEFSARGQLYGLWQPDDQSRFLVGVNRGRTSTTLVAARIQDDGSIAASGHSNRVSHIFPRNIRRRTGNEVLAVYNWQFADMQVHSEGNTLVLTYHNTEADSRQVFARVIYRYGMFEILAL